MGGVITTTMIVLQIQAIVNYFTIKWYAKSVNLGAEPGEDTNGWHIDQPR